MIRNLAHFFSRALKSSKKIFSLGIGRGGLSSQLMTDITLRKTTDSIKRLGVPGIFLSVLIFEKAKPETYLYLLTKLVKIEMF